MRNWIANVTIGPTRIDSIYLPWSKDLRNHLLTSYPLPPSVQPIPDDTALLSKYIVRLAPEMWSASRVPALTAEEKNDPDRLWEVVKDKPAAISHLDKPRSQGEQFDADWERFAGRDKTVEVAARQDNIASRGIASETKLTRLDKDNILKDAPEKYLLRSLSSQILDGPPAGILPIPKSVPALVSENNRITPPDHWQDVRHLVLMVPTKDDRNIPKALLPGSTVTIYPKNFPEDVQTLITMMGWEDVADRVVEWGFREQTPRKAQLGIPPFKLYAPKESTLRDLLTHNFDITAVPKRSFIQDISILAATPNEKERLQELLFPDNTMEFYDYTSRPRRTIIEVLRDFPSVKIPFDRIAGLLPLIRGREFSIASGGADVKDSESKDLQLELLIGIVEYKTIIRKPRQGLCSRYVKFLEPGTEIGITIKSGSNPPCDEAAAKRPLVAIAAGTGIAPIRSLIFERAMHKPFGPTLLFFGCRNRAKDFYFREEWEDLKEQSSGQFQVIPAFSRDPEAQDPSITDPYPPPTSATGIMAYDYDRGKMYVQHQIRHHAAEVCALLRQNAVIALCGSSGRMPGSVRAALRDALVMGDLAENSEQAEELLGRMDFWQEVW